MITSSLADWLILPYFRRIVFASFYFAFTTPRYASNERSGITMSAVPDSQADDQTIKYSKRAFKRTFVYLDRPLSRAPSGKKMESLKANGRIADISFTKNHSDRDMGRLLLGSFPSLLGINLKR